MAKNTRYRSLEDQLKKQENWIQEVIESLTTVQASCSKDLQHKIQEEMEHNNTRLESLIGSLDQKFNKMEQKFNVLLKVMMKEKGIQDCDASVSEPILPTPPAHMKLINSIEVPGLQQETKSKHFHPTLPKLELPPFSSGNPREWLRKCQKYFLNYQVPENQKLGMVEMFLEGKADNWFQ